MSECRHCGDPATRHDDLGHHWCPRCYTDQIATNLVTMFDAPTRNYLPLVAVPGWERR